MKTLLSLLLSALLFLAGGCDRPPAQGYTIGVDPGFFPLNLKEQTPSVFAFTDELLREISRVERVRLTRVNMSWDNLIEGLNRKQYHAILSSASPNLLNLTKFRFSDPYLRTGPVLIIPKASHKASLASMGGNLIALQRGEEELNIIPQYPEVEFTFYDTIVDVLEAVAQGNYQGCLVPILPAWAYVHNLFHETLMISSPVLTNEGLRLITLIDNNQELIKIFNRGLLKLVDDGTYQDLLDKWNLYQ